MRGATFLAASAILGVSGCGAESELQIRSLPSPISATAKPVQLRVAEANGHFLLGNIALALESYRKALRDDPQNVDAMVGLAACYDKMARFDISRRYYESALAVTPANASVLQAFAASLDLQGRAGEAGAVRREISTRLAAADPDLSAAATLAQHSVAPTAHRSEHAAAGSITVTLAPARPAASSDLQPEPSQRAHSQLSPAAAKSARVPQQAQPARAEVGLRLERMSLGEVALVMSGRSQWRPKLVHRTAQTTTVRFVPLKREEQVANVRLLNAARAQGLAARTRSLLQSKGWQRIAIGDADRTRDRTLVLYSSRSEQTARRLSRQFGFHIAREARSGGLTVLLGRDALRLTRS